MKPVRIKAKVYENYVDKLEFPLNANEHYYVRDKSTLKKYFHYIADDDGKKALFIGSTSVAKDIEELILLFNPDEFYLDATTNLININHIDYSKIVNGPNPTWQDTLINGSTLTQDNLINNGGYTLEFQSVDGGLNKYSLKTNTSEASLVFDGGASGYYGRVMAFSGGATMDSYNSGGYAIVEAHSNPDLRVRFYTTSSILGKGSEFVLTPGKVAVTYGDFELSLLPNTIASLGDTTKVLSTDSTGKVGLYSVNIGNAGQNGGNFIWDQNVAVQTEANYWIGGSGAIAGRLVVGATSFPTSGSMLLVNGSASTGALSVNGTAVGGTVLNASVNTTNNSVYIYASQGRPIIFQSVNGGAGGKIGIRNENPTAYFDVIGTGKYSDAFTPTDNNQILYGLEIAYTYNIGTQVSNGAISGGGSGYTPGTYTAVPLTGGTGSGATANITVNASGVVSAVTIVNGGTGYKSWDLLSCASIGAGTGFGYRVKNVGFMGVAADGLRVTGSSNFDGIRIKKIPVATNSYMIAADNIDFPYVASTATNLMFVGRSIGNYISNAQDVLAVGSNIISNGGNNNFTSPQRAVLLGINVAVGDGNGYFVDDSVLIGHTISHSGYKAVIIGVSAQSEVGKGGTGNTQIGYNASSARPNEYNTLLGYKTRGYNASGDLTTNTGAYNYMTVIGAEATGNASNSVFLGRVGSDNVRVGKSLYVNTVDNAATVNDKILIHDTDGFVKYVTKAQLGITQYGSGDFIQNQFVSAQVANGWINGEFRSGNLTLDKTHNPTSGNTQFNTLNITPTYNQTGTASGIIVGIRYMPVLTSVLGAHWGLWINSGKNYFGESVGIGGINPIYTLDVKGGASAFRATSDTHTLRLQAGAFQLYPTTDTTQGSSMFIAGNTAKLSFGTSINAEIANFRTSGANFLLGTAGGTASYGLWVTPSGSTNTSGAYAVIGITNATTWSVSSGSLEFRYLQMTGGINQTDTATGNLVGLYYNPSLTSLLGKNYALYLASGMIYTNGVTAAASNPDRIVVWDTDGVLRYITKAQLGFSGGDVSLTATQIAYGSSTNTITSSNKFTWNGTQLLIQNSATTAMTEMRIAADLNGGFYLRMSGSAYSGSYPVDSAIMATTGANGFHFSSSSPTGYYTWRTISPSAVKMTLTKDGQLLIGTTSVLNSSTALLQVNGESYLSGPLWLDRTSSGQTAMGWNKAGVNYVQIRLNTTSSALDFCVTPSLVARVRISPANKQVIIDDDANGVTPSTGVQLYVGGLVQVNSLNNLSDGIDYMVGVNNGVLKRMAIPSGGASDGNNYPTSISFDSSTNTLSLARQGLSTLTVDLSYLYNPMPTLPGYVNSIHQNGSVVELVGDVDYPGGNTFYGTNVSGNRGWYAQSTLAAAGSNTQIQYNNNGVFGASSDYTWNDTTKRLEVVGDMYLHAVRTPGSYGDQLLYTFADFNFDAPVQYNGSVWSANITRFDARLNGGTWTMNAGAVNTANFIWLRLMSDNLSDITLTGSQAGGLRAFSANGIQIHLPQAAATTINRVAGMQIYGLYQDTGTTSNVNIENYYALLIGKTTEHLLTDNQATVTNKWAIYQMGENDLNEFYGKFKMHNDIVFEASTNGPVIKDTANGNSYRVISTNGVLSLQQI